MRERKYFKPKSVTWWISFVPLACGCVKAAAAAHPDLAAAVAVIDEASGNMTAAQMIMIGAGGIGFRGSIPRETT